MLDRLWKLAGEKGFTAELLREFEQSEKLPDLLLLGHLRKKAGQPDAARAAFRRAGEIAPSDARPRLALAALENDAGDFAAARRRLGASRRPSRRGPCRGETWLKAGQAWQSARDAAKAAAAWEKATAVDPGNASLRLQLAQAAGEGRELDRAAAEMEKVAALESLPPAEKLNVLRELARVQLARDELRRRRVRARSCPRLLGPDHWARPELQRQLVRLYQRAGRVEELETLWTRESEQRPRDRAALLRLAELFGETGDADRQAQWLEKLLALTPRDRELRQRLARLQSERGETATAAALYGRPAARDARPAGRRPLGWFSRGPSWTCARIVRPTPPRACKPRLPPRPVTSRCAPPHSPFSQRNRFDAEGRAAPARRARSRPTRRGASRGPRRLALRAEAHSRRAREPSTAGPRR